MTRIYYWSLVLHKSVPLGRLGGSWDTGDGGSRLRGGGGPGGGFGARGA